MNNSLFYKWFLPMLSVALAAFGGFVIGQSSEFNNVTPTPTSTAAVVQDFHVHPRQWDRTVITPTVTKTVTKKVTVTKTVSARTGNTGTKPKSSGLNTHGMSITWGCHPTNGCHYGVTDLSTCHVWINAPPSLVQSVLHHEYIHVLQCRTGWWQNHSTSEAEQVADAGAIMLGATWTYYCGPCSSWARGQARLLLGG